MNTIPLHPALVHIPIGMSVFLPFFIVAIFVGIQKGWFDRKAWVLVLFLQVFIVGGAFAAYQSGEAEEDTVESIVPHDHIEDHELWAKIFIGANLFLLGLSTASLIGLQTKEKELRITTLIGATLILMLTYQLGHSGGSLIFVDGAAQAYIEPSAKQIKHQVDKGVKGFFKKTLNKLKKDDDDDD